MATLPSPSLFDDGPTDDFNLVDVYEVGALNDLAQALTQSGAKSSDNKTLIANAVKAIASDPSKEISLERVNTLGISGEVLKRIGPSVLPTSVNINSLITIFENCGIFNTSATLGNSKRGFNGRLSNTDCKFGFNEFTQLAAVVAKQALGQTGQPLASMSQEQIFTYMDATRKVAIGLDKGQLGSVDDLKRLGIGTTDTRTQVLTKLNTSHNPHAQKVMDLSFDLGKTVLDTQSDNETIANTITESSYSDTEKNLWRRELAGMSAKKGDVGLTAALITDMGPAASPAYRRSMGKIAAREYTIPSTLSPTEYAGEGYRLKQQYDAISPTTFTYPDGTFHNDVLETASDDTLTMLAENDEFYANCQVLLNDRRVKETVDVTVKRERPDFKIG